MLTSESYKQLSDRCAQLAIASTAPCVAEALMALALDYVTQAAKSANGQQTVQQEPPDGFGD